MHICSLLPYTPPYLRKNEIFKSIDYLFRQYCDTKFDIVKNDSRLFNLYKRVSEYLGESEIDQDGFEYWSSMIKPYIGTLEFQKHLLKMLNIKGKVTEWYENDMPVNTYLFTLDEYPGLEAIKILIDASLEFKNIESKLITIGDKECGKSMVLDQDSFLDDMYLDDIGSSEIRSVKLCFTNRTKKHIIYNPYEDYDSKGNRLPDLSSVITGVVTSYADAEHVMRQKLDNLLDINLVLDDKDPNDFEDIYSIHTTKK